MNVTFDSSVVNGKVVITFPENFDKSQGGTVSLSLNGDEGFELASNSVEYTSETENIEVGISYSGTQVGEHTTTVIANFGGENNTVEVPVTATVTEESTPEPSNGDPEGTGTEEKEVNDFFSRKDVNGEVIRVFEEDYWPVDFLNVEPDKFAIMPGEGVNPDCMIGDSTTKLGE